MTGFQKIDIDSQGDEAQRFMEVGSWDFNSLLGAGWRIQALVVIPVDGEEKTHAVLARNRLDDYAELEKKYTETLAELREENRAAETQNKKLRALLEQARVGEE